MIRSRCSGIGVQTTNATITLPHRRALQRVLDKMKAQVASDLSLETLAAESGYSRSHLLRLFRAVMGRSPHQWLMQLRVEQAKAMLREGSCSLINIATACGFPAIRTSRESFVRSSVWRPINIDAFAIRAYK